MINILTGEHCVEHTSISLRFVIFGPTHVSMTQLSVRDLHFSPGLYICPSLRQAVLTYSGQHFSGILRSSTSYSDSNCGSISGQVSVFACIYT